MKVGWAKTVSPRGAKEEEEEEEGGQDRPTKLVSRRHTKTKSEKQEKAQRARAKAAEAKKRHADKQLRTREDAYEEHLANSDVFMESRHKWMFYRTAPSMDLSKCTIGKLVEPKEPNEAMAKPEPKLDGQVESGATAGAIAKLLETNPEVMRSEHIWMFSHFYELAQGQCRTEQEEAARRAALYEADLVPEETGEEEVKKQGKKNSHAVIDKHAKKKARAKKKSSHGESVD